MKNFRLIFAGAAAAALAACTAGQTGPPSVTGVNPVTSSSLQFAVGTANIGGTATGMNVVATMRKSDGTSAVLVNTPALSGPFTLPAAVANSSADANGSTVLAGPSQYETGAATPLPVGSSAAPCIAGVPQQTPGTPVSAFPYVSTFGTSGGVFGIGFAPANYTSSGVPVSYTPYRVPLYAVPAGFTALTPWGGPPAYDPNGSGRGTRDGTFSTSLFGVAEGISVFTGVTPGAGTYTMNVQIPSTGGNGTVSATSTLASVTTLPTIAPPTIATAGDGPITVTYALPAGVTGAYVEVINRGGGTCAGSGTSGAAAYYTFWVTAAAGTVTVTNAMAPLPGGTSTAVAACTGDALRAYVVGFDYDHYSLTYNKALSTVYPQTPALPAKADLSISRPTNFTTI